MKRRLLAGAVLLFALGAGSCTATQYLAKRFGYASELGEPLVTLAATPIYSPLSWYTWKQHWGSHAPKPFSIAQSIVFGSLLPGFGAGMLIRGGDRKPKPVGAYGTARWSTDRELEEAQMLPDKGLVLCQTAEADIRRGLLGWKHRRFGRLLRHDGPEHCIVFAPTRSGKGVGVVVPTLLAWTGSAIVYDPKRENWQLTAGWRSTFSHCLRFDPTVEHSVRWNPLMEVRPYPYDVRDVQNLAEMLVNPDTTKEQQDHWKLTGNAFLVAAMLHVLYAERDKSLAGVLKFLTDPERTLPAQLNAMLKTRHLKEDGPHPAVAGGAREMLSRSENERSGVLSTAISFLSLYRDPIVAYNTSSSDFSLADIMCAKRPMTLYLQVPDSDFDRTRPLMRLLLNFFGRRLTEHLDQVAGAEGLRDKRHRLLYLIDEFPSLGRMPFFVSSLAFLAGYRIKCLLIAQSLNQLDQHYGRDNPILDNCHIRITYGANDAGTAKRIVELIGQASQVKTQISENDRNGLFGAPNVSRSYQEYGRPLLTPDEILSLPFPDAILMVDNLRPYRARKVLFYDDPRFASRARIAPPKTPEEQSAELPKRSKLPHWLSLAIPEVPPMPKRAKPASKPIAATPAETAAEDEDDYQDMQAMLNHDPAP